MEVHMSQASSNPSSQMRALTTDEVDAVTGGLMVGAVFKAIGEALATAARKG
jgi:hypothetical protein